MPLSLAVIKYYHGITGKSINFSFQNCTKNNGLFCALLTNPLYGQFVPVAAGMLACVCWPVYGVLRAADGLLWAVWYWYIRERQKGGKRS